MNRIIIILSCSILLAACSGRGKEKNINQNTGIMGYDSIQDYGHNRDFLKKHVRVVELRNGNSELALIPAWQGRVMTSSAEGDHGFSLGWINHDLIASKKIQQHINAFGGEKRIYKLSLGDTGESLFRRCDEFIQ
jgi:hypothetical protein